MKDEEEGPHPGGRIPDQALIPPARLVRRISASPARPTKHELLLEDSRTPHAEHLPPVREEYETPSILKAVEVSPERRAFLAAAMALGAGCSQMEIVTKDGVCACHAVCTCDTVGSQDEDATFDSKYDETGHCTCDLVCTCNTVCTCESVGDSGGGSYSYTYYY